LVQATVQAKGLAARGLEVQVSVLGVRGAEMVA
jgi:hypothetical protein